MSNMIDSLFYGKGKNKREVLRQEALYRIFHTAIQTIFAKLIEHQTELSRDSKRLPRQPTKYILPSQPARSSKASPWKKPKLTEFDANEYRAKSLARAMTGVGAAQILSGRSDGRLANFYGRVCEAILLAIKIASLSNGVS
jgi:hypothetical protein